MIKFIVNVYNSRIDTNGNTYWAMMVTDVASGASIVGKLGGSARGVAAHYMRSLGFDWDDLHVSESELPIRQFNAKVKSWPYIHSAETIRELLAEEGIFIS